MPSFEVRRRATGVGPYVSEHRESLIRLWNGRKGGCVSPAQRTPLLLEVDDARILTMNSHEIFTACVPSQRGPLFMTLIEKTFCTNVTTHTWDTVMKCALA